MRDKNKTKFLYADLTEKIIGLAYAVYNELDYGHPEKIYQNALEVEFRKMNIKYKREYYAKILYDDTVVGKYFLDFFIENKVAVELEVRRELYKSDWMQLISYLKAKNLKVGLLIVFAKSGVLIKRVAN